MISKDKRKKVQDLVLTFMGAIDRTGANADRYRELFAGMSDAQFEQWAKQLMSDEEANFYLEVVPYKNEPKLEDIEHAARLVDVQLHQYVYFRHDGAKGEPVRSRVKVPVGYLHVRRLQQILSKKTGYSTDTSKRNQVTGQLSGDSAVGRLADEEVYALKTVGADATLRELLGPRADNRDKRLGMYQAIERDGYVQYGNLRGDSRNQPGIGYMDTLLLAAGLKSDLVDSTELLRVTVDRPQEK